MSLSQKSTELENITGWEIQPYVPKPVVDFCQDDGLHTKLYKALRKMITVSYFFFTFLAKFVGVEHEVTIIHV